VTMMTATVTMAMTIYMICICTTINAIKQKHLMKYNHTKLKINSSFDYIYNVSFRDPLMTFCHFEWTKHNFGDNLGVPLIEKLISKKFDHQNIKFNLPVHNFANSRRKNIAFRKNGKKCFLHIGKYTSYHIMYMYMYVYVYAILVLFLTDIML
jgi:hypothetical protein